MSPRGPGLSQVATTDLERLLAELARLPPGTPLSRPLLSASRLAPLWEPVRVLEPIALRIAIETALSERQMQPATRVDLVWTGGESKTAYARPTAAVIRELFESAERHVLIAGYSFDHGASIFEPLHASMQSKNVAVDLYLHVERAQRGDDLREHLRREVASFFAANWPFGTPHPAIYVAPRTADPNLRESLHAKCVVVDERVAVVGSANFTDRGQSRNVGVGARIEDPGFAEALVGQFRAATHAGVFEVAG